MMKNLLKLCLCLALVGLTGCSSTTKKDQTIDVATASLNEVMDYLYVGIDKDKMPKLTQTELTNELLPAYLSIDELDYASGLISEPMMSSIAHLVVLIEMNEGADIEATKAKIKENADPRRWICVGVEDDEVIVDNKDNLIVLIMVSETADDIHDQFKKL